MLRREVGGDEGGEHVLVPVIDESIGEFLGPLTGLGRTEVVQEQQRAARQSLQFTFGVVAGAGTQTSVEVGRGGRFPAQADATGEQGADGAVRLVRLTCARGAGDQQRRAFGDPGPAGARTPGAGDLVGPDGDLRVVGQGSAVAGGDPGVGEFQRGDGLGVPFLDGRAGEADAATGKDAVEPVGERADPVGLTGEGGGQRSPP
ncbi:hypothetical protein ADK58_36210 [Streptomyces sp. XY152]|nr:hypothetical protein ADK58_36210 [Streptomyces sp. XY152]